MDIQKEKFIKRFKSTFVYDLLSETLTDEQLFEHVIDTNGDIIWFKDQTRQMWFMWQAAQKATVPDGFVLVHSGVLDLTRFMCETWSEIDKFVYKNCQNLEKYPLIQGSKTQSAIRKIGEQKFNPFLVGAGIKAMIEAQEQTIPDFSGTITAKPDLSDITQEPTHD